MDLILKPCTPTTSMDMDIDVRLKPCTTTTLQDVHIGNDTLILDRLTTLPLELLIRILSLLPTKDAAAVCVLSKRIIHVLPWITTLDFDDSPIYHCLMEPYAIERFPTFVAFVDTVLQAYQSQYLTRFRLGVGAGLVTRYGWNDKHSDDQCEKGCSPDLKSTQINAWISFPLTRCGLRELDLRFHVREEGDVQLPPEILNCETLEVLKLDINLGLDRAATLPSFRLPNLKQLIFLAAMIPEDGLVTRLVSSCPLLEDLTVKAMWKHAHFISISSPSLRRLCLQVWDEFGESHNSDFVLIHTPNLEYLHYSDDLASHYYITNMDRLVEADICIENILLEKAFEVSGQLLCSLMRPLSNVQHLTLNGECVEDLNHDDLKDQLPVFRNLKYLELGYDGCSYWDKVLLGFLNCSPVLETFVFPQGLTPRVSCNKPYADYNHEPLVLERQFCRTALASIPKCCSYHLKKIVIKFYLGDEREIDLIQFLLRHALVLEELVIFQHRRAVADQTTLESTLQNLPRASATCSIQVL